MPLSPEQRVRYARHLLLPELGETGQLRLLAGRVHFAQGVEPEARRVAEEYLRRAGVRVDRERDANTLPLPLPPLPCAPPLVEAARALSGAFAAVEAIKALTGMGRPAALDLTLLSAEDV